MNFTEEEKQELEEQYADIDPKLIQIQMLMELSQIRMLLEGAQTGSQSEGEQDVYRCVSCNETVEAGDRQAHAEGSHNAPPNVPIEDLGLFEVAEQ